MCMHVKSQIVGLVEGLFAQRALVLFLFAVRQLMVFIVPFLVEAFSADFTCEGLYAYQQTCSIIQLR